MKFLNLEPPEIPLDRTRDFVRREYAIEGEFSVLATERDLNYRIVTADSARFLLKIANCQEPRKIIDCQVEALRHIEAVAPALPVQRVVRTVRGDALSSIDDAQGRALTVHMLTWLPGEIVGERKLTPTQLFDFGAAVAHLGLALRGFFHPAAGGRELLWDAVQAPRFLPHVCKLASREDQELVRAVLEEFRDAILPTLRRLRAQVIHGDAHPYNVLMTADGKISGLIDFGDMLHGALVQDLANVIGDCFRLGHDNDAIVRHLAAGYRSVVPLEDSEIEVLPSLVAVRLVQTPLINVIRAASGKVSRNYLESFAAHCLPLLAALRGQGAGRIEALARGRPVETAAAAPLAELRARRERVLGKRLQLFYDPPLHIVRGEGLWLYDAAGRRYLDCYNNVPHVGHCHPYVTEALVRQARTLNTNTRYITDEAIEYAERLTASTDSSLSAAVYVNSGSEANDVAWRMAKAWTGKTGGLCMEYAYHGITDATDAFSPSNAPDAPLRPHVRTLSPPDDYRGPYRRGERQWAERYAELGGRAIRDLARSVHGVAAVIIDSAFMSNGILEAPAIYVQSIAAQVRAAGGLVIADEVQSGFGRLGSAMWGHEHHGLVPDFLTIGKPAGNGHPIGVVLTRPEILDRFTGSAAFFSTFGGNNVACAAGIAVLDVIRNERLIDNAAKTGAYFKAQLKALMAKYPLIGDVRGIGLALGVDLVFNRNTQEPAAPETRQLISLMRDEGVLVGSEGPHGNVVKIRPPLVITMAEVDVAVAALDRALGRVVIE